MPDSAGFLFVRLRPLALAVCCSFALGASLPLEAANEQTLQSYAEAVDFLDRWRGDRPGLDAAHERLTELLIHAPEFAPAHVEMARWYLMNSRNYPAALRSLERAESLDPEFPGTYVLRGYIFERQNRLDEALAQLDRAEAIGTDNPWLLLNRAAVFQKLGRVEEALPLFESVFEHHPDDPKAWPSAKLGLVELHGMSGDAEAAEAVLLRAKALKPDDIAEAAGYWEWLTEQNRLEEAVAMIREGRKRWNTPELAQSEMWMQLRRAHQLHTADSEAAKLAFNEASALAAELGIVLAPSLDEWLRLQEQHRAGQRY